MKEIIIFLGLFLLFIPIIQAGPTITETTLSNVTVSSVAIPGPPSWSDNSTNDTKAGYPILHAVKWTDDTNLSGYIFSFCNGTWNETSCLGGWVNDTWTPMIGAENWTLEVKVSNSTIGVTIAWKVFANDSAGGWNTTDTFTYVTTVTTPQPGPGGTGPYLPIPGPYDLLIECDENVIYQEEYLYCNVTVLNFGSTFDDVVLNWKIYSLKTNETIDLGRMTFAVEPNEKSIQRIANRFGMEIRPGMYIIQGELSVPRLAGKISALRHFYVRSLMWKPPTPEEEEKRGFFWFLFFLIIGLIGATLIIIYYYETRIKNKKNINSYHYETTL